MKGKHNLYADMACIQVSDNIWIHPRFWLTSRMRLKMVTWNSPGIQMHKRSFDISLDDRDHRKVFWKKLIQLKHTGKRKLNNVTAESQPWTEEFSGLQRASVHGPWYTVVPRKRSGGKKANNYACSKKLWRAFNLKKAEGSLHTMKWLLYTH